MIEHKEITTLEELTVLIPLFLEGYRAMNKKRKVFGCDQTGFVKTLIGVLNMIPRDAIVVTCVDNVPVGYGVAFDDTPPFAEEKEWLLWALYIQPKYSGEVVKSLFDEAKTYALARGYKVMKAYNSRFTGSAFRLFEDKLGMTRNRIQFNINL